MRIARYGKTRYWAVSDTAGMLVCLCVYSKGAREVVRRLQQACETRQQGPETNGLTKEAGSRGDLKGVLTVTWGSGCVALFPFNGKVV